jgi:hypothetical protein
MTVTPQLPSPGQVIQSNDNPAGQEVQVASWQRLRVDVRLVAATNHDLGQMAYGLAQMRETGNNIHVAQKRESRIGQGDPSYSPPTLEIRP